MHTSEIILAAFKGYLFQIETDGTIIFTSIQNALQEFHCLNLLDILYWLTYFM